MVDKVEDRGDGEEEVIDPIVKTDEIVDPKLEVVKETDEEKAARELEEAEAKAELEKKEKLTIPKARFDEAVKKARDREAVEKDRADKAEAILKAQQGDVDAAKVEARIDILEEELEQAIADGNVDKKAAARKEIRMLNQQLADGRAAVHAARATAVAIEQVRYDALVGTMETEHPELNPDNEATYDEDLVAEITEYKEAFEAKGLSSSESLKKALKAVYKAVKEVEADGDGVDAAKKASERKEAAIAKALLDKKKQPADAKKAGLDSDKGGKSATAADVGKMKDKEFDKLSNEELAKLRGDVI